MAQNREKDDIFDLKVPSESTTLSLSCSENNCKILFGPAHVSEPARVDRGDSVEVAQNRLVGYGPGPIHMKEERKRAAEESSSGGEPVKRTVNRCSGCMKRVGLTGFRCRCGDLFCADHRYSDRHDCSYDYKTAGRAAIARENPVVRAAKILKL